MDRPTVTGPVVEVGPGTVRGPGPVDRELARAAVEFIDDPIALLDDGRPEPVGRLWRNVLRSAAGSPPSSPSTLQLVCPAWWPESWVQRVTGAAPMAAGAVVVRRRAELLADRFPGRPRAVVEIAPQFLTVWAGGGTVEFVDRGDDVDALAEAVGAALGTDTTVLIDPPAEVPGAAALSKSVSEMLRRKGFSVTVVHPDWLWDRAPGPLMPEDGTAPGRQRPRARLGAAIVGAVVSVLVVLFAVLRPDGAAGQSVDSAGEQPDETPATLLVEGRVAVLVPALWRSQRITSGPGSARVQVVSPSDPHAALHITQSPLPAPPTREMVAETLDAALRDQPVGVFVDFNPTDHRADRPAVTYREIRATHHIDWTVLVDREVRIAIGCQHPAHDPATTQPVCERAIRSAHAIF